jgi:two-component system, NtrC family, sensor kinase
MMSTHDTGRRILIVDDNESIHRDFRYILGGSGEADHALADAEAALFGTALHARREGFELASAYQGQQALAMVISAREEGRPYALAFIDMRMPPGWDGVETIEQLWKHDPDLQIVICSAYSDYSWEQMANRLDLRDRLLLLKKPFDNIEIYQLASALTAKWQMTRKAASRLSELESAVEERTRELRASNDALHAEMRQRAQLEGQLALHRKLESIGQLAAGIAHEINTPIQYIGDSLHFLRSACAELMGLEEHYARLVSDDVEAEHARAAARAARAAADMDLLRTEIPRACERALGGVDRVAQIVRAMKEFAHPTDADKEPADINAALESALIVANNEYKYVAQLETRLGELPEVFCNIGELNQVFLNLVVNAAHAIQAAGHDPTSGRILVRTELQGEYVVVSIQDNGTGIASSIADKVYDPFFTTKEIGKGTGQGLAIAYAIVVTNHGGTIAFDTRESEGTTFIVRIPVSAPKGARSARAEERQLVA